MVCQSRRVSAVVQFTAGLRCAACTMWLACIQVRIKGRESHVVTTSKRCALTTRQPASSPHHRVTSTAEASSAPSSLSLPLSLSLRQQPYQFTLPQVARGMARRSELKGIPNAVPSTLPCSSTCRAPIPDPESKTSRGKFWREIVGR